MVSKNNYYIRSKTELIFLCEEAISHYGNNVRVPVAKLEGQNKEMYCAPISVILNQLLFVRLPRNYNNPEGIQRAYKSSKIKEIAELANSSKSSFPGAVIANITTGNFIKR